MTSDKGIGANFAGKWNPIPKNSRYIYVGEYYWFEHIPGIYLDVKLKILRYNKCLATGMRREAVQDERNRGSGGGGGGANNSGGGAQVLLKVI